MLTSDKIIGAGQHHAPQREEAVADDDDGITIEQDSAGVSMTLKFDQPDADNADLQQAVASYLAQQLFFVDDDEQFSVQRPAFDGDFQQFLQACVRQKWNELCSDTFDHYPEHIADGEEGISRSDAMQMAAQAAAEDTVYASSYQAALRRVYDDDSLQSWQFDYDIYVSQAAHPSKGTSGITLRKSDGQPVRPQLRDTDSPSFRQLLKQQVVQWLKDEMEEPDVTPETLRHYLSPSIRDVNALPLPQQPPYLTTWGIALCYDEGELIGALHSSVVIILPDDQAVPYIRF